MSTLIERMTSAGSEGARPVPKLGPFEIGYKSAVYGSVDEDLV